MEVEIRKKKSTKKEKKIEIKIYITYVDST